MIAIFFSFLSADKPENVHLSTSSRKICAGKMVILTCSAGDSNPAAENFTLYKNGLRLANVTRAKVGVFNQMLYTKGQHSYSCVASNAIGNASSNNTIVEVEGEVCSLHFWVNFPIFIVSLSCFT